MQSTHLAAITNAILRKFPGIEKDEVHFDQEVESSLEHDGRPGVGTWVSFEVKSAAEVAFQGAAYAWSPLEGGEEKVELFDRKTQEEARSTPDHPPPTRFLDSF